MLVPSALMWIVGALATFRLVRLFLEDEIMSGFRDKWWDKWPPESTKLGYWLTCPWCLSIWMAVPVALLMFFGGIVGVVILAILALSAATGLIYSLLER